MTPENKDNQNNKTAAVSTSLISYNFCGGINGVPVISKTDPQEMLVIRYLENIDGNHLLYMANGRIGLLEEAAHTQDQIDHLNKHGLHIHLFEPLCSYLPDDPDAPWYTVFNNGFYSEFSDDVNTGDILCAELESIYRYSINNNLTNVVVHTCDYKVEQFHYRYTNRLTLKHNDLFLNTTVMTGDTISMKKSHFSKRFISLNWRFTVARTLISALLCEKSAYLTFPYSVDPDIVMTSSWFNRDSLEKHNPVFSDKMLDKLNALQQCVPRSVDINFDSATSITEIAGHFYPQEHQASFYNPVFDNDNNLSLESFYRTSFVDIVCESRYAQPTANISEKLLQCIQFRTPFVAVGPPYTLECLREMGFKTFSNWWDESYDQIEDPVARMVAISDVIEYIDSFTDTQLSTIYEEMFPVLVRNFNTLTKQINTSRRRHHNFDTGERITWLPQDGTGIGFIIDDIVK